MTALLLAALTPIAVTGCGDTAGGELAALGVPAKVAAPDERPASDAGPAVADVPTSAADAPSSAAEPGDTTVAVPAMVAATVPATSEPASTELAAGELVRLTEPGCCTQPFWSADSRSVMFIDRPAADAPVGIWSVSVDRAGTAPQLVTDEMAFYSDDMAFRFDLEGETTTVIRRIDGERWSVPTGGRTVEIAPGGTQVAWQVSPDGVPGDRRTTRVWVANLDGTEAREVTTLPRGSLLGWLTDDTLLAQGRDGLDGEEEVLWVLDLRDGTRREIARGQRLSGELASPDGAWLAYYVSRADEPSANGIWLAPTAGGTPRKLDDTLFGAYRWRDGSRLLVVPMHRDTEAHVLLEVDAATLDARPLTDPAAQPFKTANGDWTVSPDGQYVAFVERRDKAIWVMRLP